MTDQLLACVTAGTDREAAAAWSRWRSAIDIDSIPWRDTLLVPMIPAARRSLFQEGDPAAPILTGFVRRAWTQGAVFAARARGIVGKLHAGGVGPVLIGGSTAAFLRGRKDGAVRPATDITLFLPSQQVDGAVEVLREDSWEPRAPTPPRRVRSWMNGLMFDRGKESLRVAWRHVVPPPWRSGRAERMLFAQRTESLPAEALLLSRLAPTGGWEGIIPWQADVAFLAADALDWEAVFAAASALSPAVSDRLREAHGVIAGVPRPSRTPSQMIRFEDALSSGLRRTVRCARRIAGRP
ncbi:MAG: putative nucleotidyltransferase [Planctomycetota bacterium]|jgi:hypothetical protein